MEGSFLLVLCSFKEERLGCLNSDEKEPTDRKELFGTIN